MDWQVIYERMLFINVLLGEGGLGGVCEFNGDNYVKIKNED